MSFFTSTWDSVEILKTRTKVFSFCLPQEESLRQSKLAVWCTWTFNQLHKLTTSIKRIWCTPKAQKGEPKIPVSIMSTVILLTYSNCDAGILCILLELCSINLNVNYKTTEKNWEFEAFQSMFERIALFTASPTAAFLLLLRNSDGLKSKRRVCSDEDSQNTGVPQSDVCRSLGLYDNPPSIRRKSRMPPLQLSALLCLSVLLARRERSVA